MAKAHKNNTEVFAELTYAEQSSSITSQINNLFTQIKVNVRRAKSEGRKNPVEKRIETLKRKIVELEEMV